MRNGSRHANAIAFCDNDVYDHFSRRWTLQNRARAAGPPAATLSLDSDAWQSRYFDSEGNIKVTQLRSWLSALPAA